MIVLAPMAGITDGQFCRRLASQGFDMVTLGGYNIDPPTVEAGRKIIQRGRSEFDIPLEDVSSHIEQQVNIVNGYKSWGGLVSVNLRSTTPQPMIEISKLDGVDVVEINAHCRQPEITKLGCGQSLLNHPDKLYSFTREVVRDAESVVSVKIRANVPGTDIVAISKLLDDAGADFLHVDAMKPGHPHADWEVVSALAETTNMFLIGNNSITDLESAQKMIDAGADGFSMARAIVGGTVPFDLLKVKF